MKLTNSEKLILTMLSEIYEKLGMNDGHNEIDGNFVKSAIQKNHTWALSWKYQGIAFDEEDQPHEVDEVVNYLDMWDFLEESAGSLSAADQAELVERMLDLQGYLFLKVLMETTSPVIGVRLFSWSIT
ncbi:YfbU family protein [Candidatus Symbiopectobacterium sp. NZEC135]|uniref:YfbU family protein n=1 Tax=Candidatus Symbiopectobacterium sp. NZEC135 TaxID=2820471 RepID=UPI002227B5DB|nr:YfbU family protein [Candidatus Symbiopectobacterium sp. NZEC135]